MPGIHTACFMMTLAAGTALAAEPSEHDPVAPSAADAGTDRTPQSPLETLKQSLTNLQQDVKALKGLKLSGYVQARYERNQASLPGVSSADASTPTVRNLFYIRRARFKATYTGIEWSRVVIEIDAASRGVPANDMYVALTEPWSPLKAELVAGQFKVPFGYDLPRSTADLELPELPRVLRVLFPGERDRGVTVAAAYKWLKLIVGVYNGNGIQDTATRFRYFVDANGNGLQDSGEEVRTSAALNFGATDRDHKKDASARIAVDFEWITGGASAYVGSWGTLQDGTVYAEIDPETGEVVTYHNTNQLTYIPKTRFGADLELYFDLFPRLGTTHLRGEFIQGRGVFDREEQLDAETRGWYATLVQALGTYVTLAVRVDQFDPDLADEDHVLSIEPALLLFPTKSVKVTAAYQIVRDRADDDAVDTADNLLTLQLQGRF